MTNLSQLSDEQLVKIICQQDKEIYHEIIKRYQPKLLRYVTYLTRDENQAADIVQETFIKAYINLNGFNPQKKFSSWIYRIAHNETMNSFNRSPKQQFLDEDSDFDSGVNLQDDLIKQELQNHIQDCLAQTPLLYREPLSLYFLEEKTYQEISDILRIPTSTVGTRINRAKLIIKKICQKTKI